MIHFYSSEDQNTHQLNVEYDVFFEAMAPH